MEPCLFVRRAAGRPCAAAQPAATAAALLHNFSRERRRSAALGGQATSTKHLLATYHFAISCRHRCRPTWRCARWRQRARLQLWGRATLYVEPDECAYEAPPRVAWPRPPGAHSNLALPLLPWTPRSLASTRHRYGRHSTRRPAFCCRTRTRIESFAQVCGNPRPSAARPVAAPPPLKSMRAPERPGESSSLGSPASREIAKIARRRPHTAAHRAVSP